MSVALPSFLIDIRKQVGEHDNDNVSTYGSNGNNIKFDILI